MSFEQQIQQWVSLDNQMKSLNEKLKELRDLKNNISEKIHIHVDENQLNNAAVKINDGQLKFLKIKETQTLIFRNMSF